MRVNIYIRKENEEMWNSTSKSLWVNTRLEEMREKKKPFTKKPVAEPNVAKPEFKQEYSSNNEDTIEFCKHDAVKGMCKKGCL